MGIEKKNEIKTNRECERIMKLREHSTCVNVACTFSHSFLFVGKK